MAIQVSWHDEAKTIIRLDFDPDWTFDDLRAIDLDTDVMLDEAGQKVCMIADLSKARVVPRNLPITRMREVLDLAHPNTDIIVAVGMGPMVRMMLETILRIAGGAKDRLRFAATMADAEAAIAEHRSRQESA
jgi:hypothetical protein